MISPLDQYSSLEEFERIHTNGKGFCAAEEPEYPHPLDKDDEEDELKDMHGQDS